MQSLLGQLPATGPAWPTTDWPDRPCWWMVAIGEGLFCANASPARNRTSNAVRKTAFFILNSPLGHRFAVAQAPRLGESPHRWVGICCPPQRSGSGVCRTSEGDCLREHAALRIHELSVV